MYILIISIHEYINLCVLIIITCMHIYIYVLIIIIHGYIYINCKHTYIYPCMFIIKTYIGFNHKHTCIYIYIYTYILIISIHIPGFQAIRASSLGLSLGQFEISLFGPTLCNLYYWDLRGFRGL